jgi:hypothetical protein
MLMVCLLFVVVLLLSIFRPVLDFWLAGHWGLACPRFLFC